MGVAKRPSISAFSNRISDQTKNMIIYPLFDPVNFEILKVLKTLRSSEISRSQDHQLPNQESKIITHLTWGHINFGRSNILPQNKETQEIEKKPGPDAPTRSLVGRPNVCVARSMYFVTSNILGSSRITVKFSAQSCIKIVNSKIITKKVIFGDILTEGIRMVIFHFKNPHSNTRAKNTNLDLCRLSTSKLWILRGKL